MKKCNGCGITLQNQNVNDVGYVLDLDNDYCYRCFRLKNYNDLTQDLKSYIKKEDVFNLLKDNNYNYVLIVDILNIEASFKKEVLDFLKNKKVIVIFSKCDLLPRSINFDKLINNLTRYLKNILKESEVLEVILSSKNDNNLKDILFEILEINNIKEIVFIGNSNVGKSSIINNILKNNKLVTSYFLTTTLTLNRVDYNGYSLIDTPGFVDESNAYMHIENSLIKKYIIKKTIKPKVYQIYENQSYFLEDLFRLDVYTKENSSVIFYFENTLNIHRTHLKNANKYQENHFKFLNDYKSKSFKIDQDYIEIVIDGIGFIGFKNVDKVEIKLNNKIGIFKRKGII